MSVSLIREIVDLHRRQLFGVIEVRGVGRLRSIYADSQQELQERLSRLARAGKGRTFEAQHLREVLVQVADAIRGLERGMFEHLEKTGRVAATLAPRHVVNMVTQLESRFGRMTPVVQAAQAAVVRGVYPSVAPALLTKYRSSVRLYGPQAISAIREDLAKSIVQGDSVDEAVHRVVDTAYVQQRWRAERIVRTELSYSYGVGSQRAMQDLAPSVPKMMKRLIETFDDRTGDDSIELNGQTVPVDQPFIWKVRDSRGRLTGKVVPYMQPPNRPNDRAVVIPWVASWGVRGLAAPGPVEPTTRGLPPA